jgi:hypothetical protein
LAYGFAGQHFINQQCGTFGHAPCTTARTEPAVLATKRHQMLSMTSITAHTQKTMFQSTTLEVIIKFLVSRQVF